MVTGVGLKRSEYGTHSLRRTKASIIYRATGNLRAVQILLGHSKIENTVRYLGIDVEDALALAENTEIRLDGSSPTARGLFTVLWDNPAMAGLPAE
jgi:integrase